MYHCKDGLFFEPLPYGDLRVVLTSDRKLPEPDNSNVAFATTLQRSVVASVMALACARGYNTGTFYEAYSFLQHPHLAARAPEMHDFEVPDGN